MTVIAFRDGVVATDTLTIGSGGERMGDCTKAWVVGRAVVSASGSSALADRFVAWVAAGMPGDAPKLKAGDASAHGYVFLPDGKCLWVVEDAGPTLLDAPFYAFGSAATFALGAMHQGASAARAVEVAIAASVWCGGDVRQYRVGAP